MGEGGATAHMGEGGATAHVGEGGATPKGLHMGERGEGLQPRCFTLVREGCSSGLQYNQSTAHG